MPDDKLVYKVLALIPTAQFEVDNEGQLLIYTGLYTDSEDTATILESDWKADDNG